VRPENEASKRVLAKAGLHPEGLAHHYGADVELWAMDAPPLT
jgi:RimJ/RimL family protein N-acetyltransferase